MSDILKCDVAVIGAGTSGLNAWRAANGRGKRTVIVERGPGGTTCARVGCMPSKLLIAAARAAHEARGAELFGVRVGAVGIDGRAVMARLRAERDHFVASACGSWFAVPADRRIDGEARFVGPTVLQVKGGPRIEAGAVVIATGSRPVVPRVLHPVLTHVRTFETIFDEEAPPRRLAVVGAGPLGLELAQAFSRLGSAVTVFDGGSNVAKLTDPDAAAFARDAFGRAFDLKLDTELERAEPAGGALQLGWAGGSGEFDLVLAASGVQPELGPLDLPAAGLELNDRGEPLYDPVTRRCGGSSVFVAGDASDDRPVLHEAALQGEAAGVVATGGEAKPRMPAFSMTFTDPGIVLVGCGHDALPEGARVGRSDFASNGRARIERGPEAEGVARLYADRDGRLIGGVLVGPAAEHPGHLLAHAVARGAAAAELAEAPYYHPCLEEVLRNAARDLAGAG